MQRVDFNLGFYEYLRGLEPIPRLRRWGAPAHDQRDRYRAVEPLTASGGLGTVAEYRRLREYTGCAGEGPGARPIHPGRLHRRRVRLRRSHGRDRTP